LLAGQSNVVENDWYWKRVNIKSEYRLKGQTFILTHTNSQSVSSTGSAIVIPIFSTHARTSNTAIFCGLSFNSVAAKDLGTFVLALVDLQFYRPEFVSTHAGVDTVSFDSRAFIFFCWCNVIILNLKCNHMAMLFEMCNIVTIISSVRRQQQPEELDFQLNAKFYDDDFANQYNRYLAFSTSVVYESELLTF